MKKRVVLCACVAVAALSGCATEPTSPMVNVMPGPGESYDKFRADQAECEDAAHRQVAGQADEANGRAVGSAVAGAVIGAAVGQVLGGGGYWGREMRTEGAVQGTAVGAVIGADSSNRAGWSLQRQYDYVYSQCMYAHDAQVPGFYPQTVTPPGVAAPGQYYAPPPGY